jgi:multicomponent Na+:H+ antiporter subunit E
MAGFSVKTGMKRALALALCWWALTENAAAWAFGAPIILLAAAASLFLGPGGHRAFRNLPFFLAFFLWNSLRSGIDVARRALHPRMPLAPAVMDFPLRLTDPAACVLLVNTVNLLPGTVVAELTERRLRVHVLDRHGPVPESLRSVEEQVAALFGLPLDRSEEAPRA